MKVTPLTISASQNSPNNTNNDQKLVKSNENEKFKIFIDNKIKNETRFYKNIIFPLFGALIPIFNLIYSFYTTNLIIDCCAIDVYMSLNPKNPNDIPSSQQYKIRDKIFCSNEFNDGSVKWNMMKSIEAKSRQDGKSNDFSIFIGDVAFIYIISGIYVIFYIITLIIAQKTRKFYLSFLPYGILIKDYKKIVFLYIFIFLILAFFISLLIPLYNNDRINSTNILSRRTDGNFSSTKIFFEERNDNFLSYFFLSFFQVFLVFLPSALQIYNNFHDPIPDYRDLLTENIREENVPEIFLILNEIKCETTLKKISQATKLAKKENLGEWKKSNTNQYYLIAKKLKEL